MSKFYVKSNFYTGEVECIEVDENGYDIYIDSQDDPINLGEVFYTENSLNQQEVNDIFKRIDERDNI